MTASSASARDTPVRVAPGTAKQPLHLEAAPPSSSPVRGAVEDEAVLYGRGRGRPLDPNLLVVVEVVEDLRLLVPSTAMGSQADPASPRRHPRFGPRPGAHREGFETWW